MQVKKKNEKLSEKLVEGEGDKGFEELLNKCSGSSEPLVVAPLPTEPDFHIAVVTELSPCGSV